MTRDEMRARLEAIREPKWTRDEMLACINHHETYVYPFAINDSGEWAFRWQHPGEFLEINFK